MDSYLKCEQNPGLCSHLALFFFSAAPKFQQADYPISQLDQQFTYVDFADIKWDPVSESWTQIPNVK